MKESSCCLAIGRTSSRGGFEKGKHVLENWRLQIGKHIFWREFECSPRPTTTLERKRGELTGRAYVVFFSTRDATCTRADTKGTDS